MKLKVIVITTSIFFCNYSLAGHGFFNSFEGINWLPESGLTPGDFFYAVDAASEKITLHLTKDSYTKKKKYLDLAEERLAEGISLLKQGNIAYSTKIENEYDEYLKKLRLPPYINEDIREVESQQKYAERLLQHMYILSVEVLGTPRSMHKYFLNLNEMVTKHYEHITESLSRDFVDSHFFKKEEVKWSWEIAFESN